MRRHGVAKLVFSSSATVYGADAPVPMREDLPTSATNPYGWTKVMQEQVLRDVAAADPSWRIALLRYFNPVGAHPSGTIGEDPSDVPNNLMPYLAQVAVGRREKLYDLRRRLPHARRHRRARLHPRRGPRRRPHRRTATGLGDTTDAVSTWNLGTGHGTSVLELLHAFERACGHELPYEIVDRRPGDVAASYADPVTRRGGARLARHPHRRRHVRRHVALAEPEPATATPRRPERQSSAAPS